MLCYRQSDAKKTNVLNIKKKIKAIAYQPTMQLCYRPIILHFIIHFQSSSSSVTSKSPAHKFSTQNTTAFDEARQFRFSVITFLALENKCSLATDVPAAVWRLLLLTDTFGSSSPTKTVDFGYAKVSARRGKLPAVDS